MILRMTTIIESVRIGRFSKGEEQTWYLGQFCFGQKSMPYLYGIKPPSSNIGTLD